MAPAARAPCLRVCSAQHSASFNCACSGARGHVEACFAAALSVGHGLELLTKHGIATFAKFFAGILRGTSSVHVCRARRRPSISPRRSTLSTSCASTPTCSPSSPPSLVTARPVGKLRARPDHRRLHCAAEAPAARHPKLVKLLEIVVAHFGRGGGGGDSRVMIFSQFRDSVNEIVAALNTSPVIKVDRDPRMLLLTRSRRTASLGSLALAARAWRSARCGDGARLGMQTSTAATGRAVQVPPGRVEHAGRHVRRRGGPRHWRGRPDCLLRLADLVHPARAAHGPHRSGPLA